MTGDDEDGVSEAEGGVEAGSDVVAESAGVVWLDDLARVEGRGASVDTVVNGSVLVDTDVNCSVFVETDVKGSVFVETEVKRVLTVGSGLLVFRAGAEVLCGIEICGKPVEFPAAVGAGGGVVADEAADVEAPGLDVDVTIDEDAAGIEAEELSEGVTAGSVAAGVSCLLSLSVVLGVALAEDPTAGVSVVIGVMAVVKPRTPPGV